MSCSRGHARCALDEAASAFTEEAGRRGVHAVIVVIDPNDMLHALACATGYGPRQAVEVLRTSADSLEHTLDTLLPETVA